MVQFASGTLNFLLRRIRVAMVKSSVRADKLMLRASMVHIQA